MAKGWYVVHTYSGYENKVEKHIRALMETVPEIRDSVFEIKIPSEVVVEVKDGKRKEMNKKFLPGYILIEMDLPALGWKSVCAQIRKIQGVTGFVGSIGASQPQPISAEEARGIFQKAGEIKAEKNIRLKQTFAPGESVRIIEGPFDTFTGVVDEVNLEKGKLRVMVGIFGRSTPVEVDFLQVEKL
ncbi:MAG: transcription termination/antitermination protein NusG [Spirochaetales bacterium]|jgi:transcriptional antiterminator NusG|nr:transcription termination/antitermination protein NusG [Spirochaetales bacterium]